jgi:hypothetical protein
MSRTKNHMNHDANDMITTLNEQALNDEMLKAFEAVRTISVDSENSDKINIKLTNVARTDLAVANSFKTSITEKFDGRKGITGSDSTLTLDRQRIDSNSILDIALALDEVTDTAVQRLNEKNGITESWQDATVSQDKDQKNTRNR